MGMSGGMTACVAFTFIILLLMTVYLIVPTEQTVGADFPNVVFLTGFGSEPLEPVSHDNSTMPGITAADASRFNGVYQFSPLFYHKSFDRFIPWEDRGKATIFSCAFWCGPMNTTGENVQLALIHYSADTKRHLWYLIELFDEDANSPILYARTKFRKAITYRVPWVTVTDGGNTKSKDLPDVYITSAWCAFRFDTPLKWGVTVALVGATIAFFKYNQDDD
eukprot:TRINITY_DN91545_c0_g1_i1.p2 TRINITY_DN91545_c0_g1~~TRINITY_DN91545_c0_g1_i1.p2  ORF type:complete len:221 (-),score=38.39 TRINITY_DN91545_c0_g1_i1:377-1039(-)